MRAYKPGINTRGWNSERETERDREIEQTQRTRVVVQGPREEGPCNYRDPVVMEDLMDQWGFWFW
uniref:Uncharacterized protein n=1 Tax=Arion vulgaris TaxID=1028688 RepID=A0A0B7BII5_9EUPU